jgi:chromosome segregation protein
MPTPTAPIRPPTAAEIFSCVMLLKSIELFGFKTFADRQKFVFDTGITALLGPNGCGKSNIVDAIKWVLGEQSAKALRVEKMTDLIFNGSAGRKALNIAEVAVIIANDKGLLPADITELEVKRRIFRSGENEYSVNNRAVKLKTLREMFFDTGLNKGLYSIIEQGRIDQALSAKTEERRLLFEEAAGLSRYRSQSAEAESRLMRTDDNIMQVRNLLAEITRHCDSLQMQTVVTRRHKALKKAQMRLEIHLGLLRIHEKEEQRQKHAEICRQTEQKRENIARETERLEKEHTENRRSSDQGQSDIMENHKELFRLEAEDKKLEEELKILEELQHHTGELIQQASERAEEERRLLAAVKEKQQAVARQLNLQNQALTGLTEQLAASAKTLAETEHLYNTVKERYSQFTAARDRLLQQQHNITNQTTRLTQKIAEEIGSLSAAGTASATCSAADNLEKTLAKTAALLLSLKNQPPSATETDVLSLFETALDKLQQQWQLYKNHAPDFTQLEHIGGLIGQKSRYDEELRKNQTAISTAEQNAAEAQAEAELTRTMIEELKAKHQRLLLEKIQKESGLNALTQQQEHYANETAQTEKRLTQTLEEFERCRGQKENHYKTAAAKSALKAEYAKKYKELKKTAEILNKEFAANFTAIKTGEEALTAAQKKLFEANSLFELETARLKETDREIKAIKEAFWEANGQNIESYGYVYTGKVHESGLKKAIAVTKKTLTEIGAVNMLAEEEFAEAENRLAFLHNQLNDLEKARLDLKELTVTMRSEAEELFLSSFNKIKENFSLLFVRLFDGGHAELRLSDSRDVLDCDIEIIARPPGKKSGHIAGLSGGERSLGAIALLFAFYLLRPSPFCLFDEVDAALDESNVGRLAGLFNEFGSRSQFILITHNKKTASIADTLLGVTMQESGVSKHVSLKIGKDNG